MMTKRERWLVKEAMNFAWAGTGTARPKDLAFFEQHLGARLGPDDPQADPEYVPGPKVSKVGWYWVRYKTPDGGRVRVEYLCRSNLQGGITYMGIPVATLRHWLFAGPLVTPPVAP